MNEQLLFWGSVFAGGFCLFFIKAGIVAAWNRRKGITDPDQIPDIVEAEAVEEDKWANTEQYIEDVKKLAKENNAVVWTAQQKKEEFPSLVNPFVPDPHYSPGEKPRTMKFRQRCNDCGCWLDEDSPEQRAKGPAKNMGCCVPCQEKHVAEQQKFADEELSPQKINKEVDKYFKGAPHRQSFVVPSGMADKVLKELEAIDKEKEHGPDWAYLRTIRSPDAGQKPPVDRFFRPQDKEFVIRILPPPKRKLFGDGRFPDVTANVFETARQHYLHDTKVVQCSNKLDMSNKWEGDCPICKYYNDLIREVDRAEWSGGNEELREKSKKVRPVERYYYNIAVVKHGSAAGPLIWSVGRSLHERLVRLARQHKDDITDIHKGTDIRVTREERGPFWSYEAQPCGNGFAEVRRDERNFVLANQVDLIKLVDQWHQSSSFDLCWAAAELRGEPRDDLPPRWENIKHGKRAVVLKKGQWVFWETQKGTMSVRPSIVFTTGFKGSKQQVLLKYKSGSRWETFWTEAQKCVPVDSACQYEYTEMYDEWRRQEQQEAMKKQACRARWPGFRAKIEPDNYMDQEAASIAARKKENYREFGTYVSDR